MFDIHIIIFSFHWQHIFSGVILSHISKNVPLSVFSSEIIFYVLICSQLVNIFLNWLIIGSLNKFFSGILHQKQNIVTQMLFLSSFSFPRIKKKKLKNVIKSM